MLSRADYLNYLDQMKKIEESMITLYTKCAAETECDFVKKTCLRISDDEKRHALLVEELKKLIV